MSQSYVITVVERGQANTYNCQNAKRKNQWFYEYLTNEERMWAWAQWQNSPYKTFDKWFKEYIKPQWKESNVQSLRINKKIIVIKNIKGR